MEIALCCISMFSYIINLISRTFHCPTHPSHFGNFCFFFILLVVLVTLVIFVQPSPQQILSGKEVDILYLLLLHVLVHLGTSRLMNMGQLMDSLQMILQRPGLDLQRPDFQFTRYKIIIKKTLNFHSFTVKVLMGFYLQLKELSRLQ